MIAIVNISKCDSPFGVHEYELRINSQVITRFEHTREDGLIVCLQKAARAAEKAELEKIDEMLKRMPPNSIITGRGE